MRMLVQKTDFYIFGRSRGIDIVHRAATSEAYTVLVRVKGVCHKSLCRSTSVVTPWRRPTSSRVMRSVTDMARSVLPIRILHVTHTVGVLHSDQSHVSCRTLDLGHWMDGSVSEWGLPVHPKFGWHDHIAINGNLLIWSINQIFATRHI